MILIPYIDDVISSANIKLLFYITLLFEMLFVIQDIAVDGFSVTLLHKENLSYASFAQSLGTSIGAIISYNLYIWLSSSSFCKDYLGIDFALLNPVKMLCFMAVFLLLGNLILHFFQKESCVPTKRELGSFKEIL